MIVSESKIRVRYGDTDKMGYCYYGKYPEFYEVARGDAFRESGCSYRELEERGYMMPVVSLDIHYKKPAFYDDLITVRVAVKKMPGVKMEFEYESYNEAGELINHGTTVLCFVNMSTGRPCMAPDFFMDVIKKHF